MRETETEKRETRRETRRDFLKLASVSVPAMAAAAMTGSAAKAEATAVEGKGYRKTAHIKTYLETARF